MRRRPCRKHWKAALQILSWRESATYVARLSAAAKPARDLSFTHRLNFFSLESPDNQLSELEMRMCLLAVCMTYLGLCLDLVTFHRTKYRSLRPLLSSINSNLIYYLYEQRYIFPPE